MSGDASERRQRAHASADLRELIELADDEDPDVRWVAASRMGELASGDAVPKLLALLRAGDPSVRCAAVRSLGQLGAAEAVEPLVEIALTDDEGFVRGWSLDALARIGDASVAGRLRPLLDVDMRPYVAVSAAASLAALGDPVGRARYEAHIRSERWLLPGFRSGRSELPPSRPVFLALTATWLVGTAVLQRWWEGWPQLLLALGFVLAMHEAWLGARQRSALRAGVFASKRRSLGGAIETRVKAAAIATAWAAALGLLLSFDIAQFGVYTSVFFLVYKLVRDSNERRTRSTQT